MGIDVRAASLDADSGGFVSSGQRLESAGAGPIVSSSTHGFVPHADFLAGFARYSDVAGNATPWTGNCDR